jgi:signal peptidase I
MNDPNHGLSSFDELSISLLAQRKSIRFRGRGNSMAPTIPDGSVTVIDPITRPPKWGDILLFQSGSNRLIIHRVIYIKRINDGKRLYLMQGDANPFLDGWISEENVLGIARLPNKQWKTYIFLAVRHLPAAVRYIIRRVFRH